MAKRPIGEGAKDAIYELVQVKSAELCRGLPSHIKSERYSRILQTALRRDPALMDSQKTDRASLQLAIMGAAQLGLELFGPLGQAHLVRYGREATLVVGYKGYIELALRSGKVSSISAAVVYEKDEFDYALGTDAHVSHKPPLTGDRGEKVAAYAVARLTDGQSIFEVMRGEDIVAIKNRVLGNKKNTGASPWVNYEDEMWRKTVVRRLAKYLPLTGELALAVAAEEAQEAGLAPQWDHPIKDVEATVVENDPEPEAEPEVGPTPVADGEDFSGGEDLF